MTDKTAHAFWAFILDEAKKWLARTVIMGTAALALFLLTPLKDRIGGIWTSPDQLAEISAKLDLLTTEVQKATGEDRVIFETAGLSYVREPVHLGDKILYNLVVRRTRLGAACTLLNRTPIFTDESNISSAGPTERPARQVSGADTPLRILLDIPAPVSAGRVTVYLSLEFECPGANGTTKTVFDQTRPVAFMLLPKRGTP